MSEISLGGAITAQPASWSITHALNAGWTGSLGFGHHINTRFDADALITLLATDNQGQTLSNTKLLGGQRTKRWGRTNTSSVELLDETSWKLSGGSESFDTFLGGSADDIVAAVGTRFGVTFSGAPTFALYKEDVQLSTGWDPVRRIAVVGGKVLLVTAAGVVQFQNSNWTSGTSIFKHDEAEEGYRPLDRVNRLFVTKTSGYDTPTGPQYYDFSTAGNVSGELHWPLSSASLVDESSVGSVAWVTLWDGPSGNPESSPIAIYSLNGDTVDGVTEPVNGTWPATHFTAIVYPSFSNPDLPIQARLKINGSPQSVLPAGIDGAIAKSYGTGRGAVSTFSDSMIPSEAHADTFWEHWLKEANRGTDYLTARGPLDCSVAVGQAWSGYGLSGRIEQVTWSGGGSSPRTEIVVNLDVDIA